MTKRDPEKIFRATCFGLMAIGALLCAAAQFVSK